VTRRKVGGIGTERTRKWNTLKSRGINSTNVPGIEPPLLKKESSQTEEGEAVEGVERRERAPLSEPDLTGISRKKRERTN